MTPADEVAQVLYQAINGCMPVDLGARAQTYAAIAANAVAIEFAKRHWTVMAREES